MRFLFSFFLAVLLIVVVILGINYYANSAPSSTFFSPLPSVFSKVFYPPQKSNDYWMPDIKALVASEKLDLSAESALSYDLTGNEFIYEKNINEKLPIASLTKIMTAIVALENEKPTDRITVSSKAANIGEDSMGLSEGETWTLKDLLYGLFLQSGNDAAEAIADASPYGRDNFIHLMNKKAEDLGLSSTHFTNPTGLEGDGDQYSTAHDLLVMTRYALEKPLIAQIVQTYNYNIPYSPQHKEIDLYNETNLITSYPGVKGVKTGYTPESGLCLVTYLDYGGHKIIAILLKSENRRQEMKDLLDYSLKSLGVAPPAHE